MPALKYPDFKGPAKQLEDLDLPRIGHEIGVGEDEVHMLMDVESAGDGFDAQGRPKMLFEPHIFYKELTKHGDKKVLDAAVKAGVAYKVWKTKPYPKDSYPNLLKAMTFQPEAALRSASWGAEQMMGFNYSGAGYSSVFDMVNAHCEDEENHIQSMINFVKENNLDDDLQRLAALKRPTTAADCAPIARVYNGSSYAENHYDSKLAAAHNKWRKIPDTPWSPDAPVAKPAVIEAQGDTSYFSRDVIRGVQQTLKDKGYAEVGIIDGKAGKDTAIAVSAFQIVEGLPVDGKISQTLIDRLQIAKMRPVSESRANASKQDVINESVPAVASTVKSATLVRNIGAAALGLFGLGGVTDGGVPDLDQFSTGLNKTHMIMGLIGDKLPWLIGIGVAAVAVYYAHKIIARQIEGFKKGTVR